MQSRVKRNWDRVKKVLLGRAAEKSKIATQSSPFVKECRQTDKEFREISYKFAEKTWICYEKTVTLKEKMAQQKRNDTIDGTGSWIWLAEQMLARLVIDMLQHKTYRSILELGAGCSGMAALCCRIFGKPQVLSVTDGKQENLKTVRMNFEKNGFATDGIFQLLWGQTPIHQKYDLIFGADCLFFDNYHEHLLKSLKSAMDEHSLAVFVNPKRGNTMDLFIERAIIQGFKCQLQPYEDVVKEGMKTNEPKQDHCFFVAFLRL